MNAISVDIKDMLVDDTDLVFGTNLFISREPTSPNSCVTIYDTPGEGDDLYFNPDERYERGSIQVRVRDNNYINAWTRIDEIRQLLHGRANETRNGAYYTAIRLTSGPAMLEYDDNGRVILVTNFNVQRR